MGVRFEWSNVVDFYGPWGVGVKGVYGTTAEFV